MKYYLAYGSNLHVAQMQRRCPGAIPVGTAWIEGYRLAFRGSKTGAYLTIIPDRRTKVPVGVWLIDRDHELALDIYEGFPTFYRKKTLPITITRADGTQEAAEGLVYLMPPSAKKGIPSEKYVSTCAVGYRCFGLDAQYLLRAVVASRPRRAKKKPITQSKWEAT